mgnify:CR=1 FL=1|jgi:hypothetical protein
MRLKTRVSISCDWCGEPFEKWPSKITPKNFCCRDCLAAFSNKSKNPDNYGSLKDYTKMGEHFSRLNRKLNPSRMTAETRAKLGEYRLGSGEGVTYTKLYGVHEHRVVAERLLGRPLVECEVVHHIDGDKRNNRPDNIQIFPSQSEHAEYHARLTAFFNMQGGDAR